MSQVPRRVDPFEDRERAVALAQRRHHGGLQLMGRADDLAGPPGTLQIAREDRGHLDRGEPGCLGGALALAPRRERHVEVTDEPARLGEHDLTVPEEVDQAASRDHADTVRRPASSAISIAAPRTSPVIPATRVATNRATATALKRETAITRTPSERSAIAATSSARVSAIGAARTLTLALNAAPNPSVFAAGNNSASSGGVARATTGTTSSARGRT